MPAASNDAVKKLGVDEILEIQNIKISQEQYFSFQIKRIICTCMYLSKFWCNLTFLYR